MFSTGSSFPPSWVAPFFDLTSESRHIFELQFVPAQKRLCHVSPLRICSLWAKRQCLLGMPIGIMASQPGVPLASSIHIYIVLELFLTDSMMLRMFLLCCPSPHFCMSSYRRRRVLIVERRTIMPTLASRLITCYRI
jgi:hypothetical protein